MCATAAADSAGGEGDVGAEEDPRIKQARPIPASQPQLTAHALATGFSRGLLVAAGIGLLALLIGLATIRVRREELTGTGPAPQEDTAREPATVPQHEDRAALAAAFSPCRHC